MITVVYSLIHMFVDGLCALCMFGCFANTKNGYFYILIYNFCAFAMQLPFGFILDFLLKRKDKKACLFLPFLSSFVGAFLCMVGGFFATIGNLGELAAGIGVVILGLGNALFHVGGGVDCIREDESHRSGGARLGMFVAPGALGLALGKMFAKRDVLYYLLIDFADVSIFILMAALVYYIRRNARSLSAYLAGFTKDKLSKAYFIVALTMCFAVVVLRSHVGMAVSFPWKTGTALIIGSVIAVVLGKMAGGFFGARFGLERTVWISLFLAAFCFIFSDFAPFGMAALLFFNMTMPVTLYLLVKMMPEYPGGAFGILTFALFVGFLPTYYGIGDGVRGNVLGLSGSMISLGLLAIAIILIKNGAGLQVLDGANKAK